jgi:ParB family chromosome partitioning protein
MRFSTAAVTQECKEVLCSMASTRSTLEAVADHLAESIGVRSTDSQPQMSPISSPKDAGRRPLRQFGRIDVGQVMADPNQPREAFLEEGIERLAKSIQEKGQLSPIRVRWSDERRKWMIVAGERRWRASLRAGLPTIQCYFHEAELAPSEILEQQLIENCLREDLRPTEEAKAFQRLMQLNSWNQKKLATALRISETRVTRVLSLLKLPQEVHNDIDSGKISARAAYEISKLPNSNAQRELARRATSATLTCNETVKAVRTRRGKARHGRPGTHLTFLTEVGWKVTVSNKRKAPYEEVEQALSDAVEEVRHRIRNRVRLF